MYHDSDFDLEDKLSVPPRYKSAALYQVYQKSPRAIREEIIPRLRAFLENGAKGPGFSIYGTGMTGKTHVMCAMLNEAKARGIQVAKIGAWEHYEKAQEDAIIEHCSRVPILLIDALDTATKYDMEKNYALSMIASMRVKSGFPTFTTSWRSPANCLERIRSGEKADDNAGSLAYFFETIVAANDAIEVVGENFFTLKTIHENECVMISTPVPSYALDCADEMIAKGRA